MEKTVRSPKRHLVLVFATGQTGSTLLDLLFSNRTNCASLGEFVHIHKHLQTEESNCLSCKSACESWRKFIKLVTLLSIYEAAINSFGTPISMYLSMQLGWASKAISCAAETQGTPVKFIRLRTLKSL